MKNFNVFQYFKKFKEKVKFELKYLIWRIVPITGFSIAVYHIYNYKLYKFNDYVLSLSEEKQIAKKLYPLIKFRYVDRTYDENTNEYKLISRLYKIIVDTFKFNLKTEVFVIKSDLLSLFMLPTGSMFISDVNQSHLEFYLFRE
jgi:hypothetical protein